MAVDYSNVHALDDFHLVMKALLLLDSITMTLFLNMASVLLPLEIIGFSYYLLRIFCWKNKKKVATKILGVNGGSKKPLNYRKQ